MSFYEQVFWIVIAIALIVIGVFCIHVFVNRNWPL